MAARRRESKRKDFPPNLYMKRDGYFWYRNPETKQTKGLGRDRATAFREARGANAALAAKESPSLTDWVMGKTGSTVAEWADDYEEIYINTRNAAVNTIKTLKTVIRAIKAAPFAEKWLRDVTSENIHDFVTESAEKRGPRMAIVIRSTMLDMFREAEVRGKIDKNPVTITKNPTATVKRDRLSLEQFMAIREHLRGWERNAADLALLSGQRREEVSSAQFKDFKDGFWYCTQKKTGTKLRIPVDLRLDAVGMSLDDVVKACRDSIVSKHLIHHSRVGLPGYAKAGGQVWIDTISKAFARARNDAGIDWQEGRTPPTFHEIRSLSERLYAEQYGSEFTQRLLGHKSPKMTAVYHDARGSEWLEVKIREK